MPDDTINPLSLGFRAYVFFPQRITKIHWRSGKLKRLLRVPSFHVILG